MIRAIGLVAALLAGAAQAEIASATYQYPTSAYGHNVVPGGEYARLQFELRDGTTLATDAVDGVYEDTAPRLIDLDGDGSPEVLTVFSYFDAGAAIRVWDEVKGGGTIELFAEGTPIGQRFRWLAIIGAADLDSDGIVEIAYVDRPHLAKTIRVVRVDGDGLELVASFAGVTNHRIGEPDIAGGIRDCGQGPEMIVASANWSELLAVTFDGDFSTLVIGTDTSRAAFADAMAC